MTRQSTIRILSVLLLVFVPSAYADGVAIEAVISIGWLGVVILMAFTVLVESIVWYFVTSMKLDQTVTLVLVINLASLASGVPVFILKEYFYKWVLPSDLTGQYRWYPVALALVLLIYFVVTIAIEFIVAVARLKRTDRDGSARRVGVAVLASNTASYGVLGGLMFWSLTPTYAVETDQLIEFWANVPAERILFIEPESQFLAGIDSNGSKQTVLFSFEMRAYIVGAEINTCVFLGLDGAWYFAKRGQPAATPIGVGNASTPLQQIAISPLSQSVALLLVTGPTRSRLAIFQSDDSSVTDIQMEIPESAAALAWSTIEDTLYLQGLSRWKIQLGQSGSATITPVPRDEPVMLAPYFGRFGFGNQWHSEHSGQLSPYEQDFCNDHVAFVWFELESRVLFGRRNPNPEGRGDHFWDTRIGASPKYFPFPQSDRQFREVAFLPGCNEAVFNDNEFLYLYSISENKLGTITRGHTWTLLNDQYAPSLEISGN